MKLIKYIVIIWIIVELLNFAVGGDNAYEERSMSKPEQRTEETIDRSKFRNLCEREAYGFSFSSFRKNNTDFYRRVINPNKRKGDMKNEYSWRKT